VGILFHFGRFAVSLWTKWRFHLGSFASDKNRGFKIPSKSSLYEGFYVVGGSTHPGGGAPMVVLAGQLTADLIKENELQKAAK
jgi:phytoene dehydrogenase-like protein